MAPNDLEVTGRSTPLSPGATVGKIERLAAWRDRLAPLVGAVRSSIEDARGRAAGIGDRVDEAVDPLSEAISALSDRLAAFAELTAPRRRPRRALLRTSAPRDRARRTGRPGPR